MVFPPYQGTRCALPQCSLPSNPIPPLPKSDAGPKLLTALLTSSPPHPWCHHHVVATLPRVATKLYVMLMSSKKKSPKARQTKFCQKPVKVSFSFISIGCFHETDACKLHWSCYQSSSLPPDQHNPASHSAIRRPNLQITPVRIKKHRYLPISPPKTMFFRFPLQNFPKKPNSSWIHHTAFK